MIGKTVSHYEILEKIGEGGMGTVYKARDLDLDRIVALKFLKQKQLTDESELKRFRQEARTAASLDHPNICTVYEIGHAEDTTFIAMAYLEGTGIDERIRSGPLPLKQAVEIATQIAEGLHVAHQKGVVHRDVKSANVIVSEAGNVKITDFGLALREGQSRLTRPGFAVGTSLYMSPEQCRAEEVDRRSDIWSLGVVLYEMIAGRPPFEAEHGTAVVYAILNEEPDPVTALRSRVPMELERVVDRALSKNPGERYQHADEMAAELRRVLPLVESTASRRAVVQEGGGRARLRSPIPWIAAAAIALVIAAVVIFYPSQTVPFAERGWMIIADFDNETGEAVFDGLVSEALSIDVQQSQYVNVYPRRRIEQTLERMGKEDVTGLDEETAREVALREGLGAVLSGAIDKVGSSYILSARIVVPSTGEAVKTVRAEAETPDDVLGAIDDLSKQVRRDLGESMLSIRRNDKPLANVTTKSLQALQYYTLAAPHVLKARWDDAIPLLHKAIEEDSSFAIAYSKLGVIYSNLNNMADSHKYSEMARERAQGVTERERYYIEARYNIARGNRKRAIENYKLLVELYPDAFHGHNNLAFQYQYTYQYEEALAHAQEAKRIDPTSWYAHYNLAAIYAGLGRYEEAVASLQKSLEISPGGFWAHLSLSWTYSCRDLPDEARVELDRLPSDDDSWHSLKMTYLASLHRSLGQDEAALSVLRKGISVDDLAGRTVSQSWKWTAISEIALARGDVRDAAGAAERAASLSRSVRNLTYLGAAYASAGRWAESDSIVAELEEPWGWEKSHIDLARIERLKGEREMARRRYDSAARVFERSTVLREHLDTRYRLGQALYRAGDYDGAIREFEFVIARRYGSFFEGSPDVWPLSLYHKGLALQAKGEKAAAAATFERFLSTWKDADPGRAEVHDARMRVESIRGSGP